MRQHPLSLLGSRHLRPRPLPAPQGLRQQHLWHVLANPRLWCQMLAIRLPGLHHALHVRSLLRNAIPHRRPHRTRWRGALLHEKPRHQAIQRSQLYQKGLQDKRSCSCRRGQASPSTLQDRFPKPLRLLEKPLLIISNIAQ